MLILGEMRMPGSIGGLLRRGVRYSALCTRECSLDMKLVMSRRIADGFGLGSRLVDRYRGRLKGDIKYLVRMPVQGVVGRKVLYRSRVTSPIWGCG